VASLFPASVDTFSTPTAGSATSSPSHATLHVNVNNAITNAQTYMGMTLISTTTIGTAVSSVTVSSAFSTTYDNYKIIVNGGLGSSAQFLRLQIGAASTAYYLGYAAVNFATGATENANVNNGALFSNAGIMDTTNINMSVEVFSPFLTKSTYVNGSIATSGRGGAFAGYLSDATSYTSFVVSPTSGTMTGGTIRVYGYRQ